MVLAVSYEDGKVFEHFGHTKQFKLYEIWDGKIEDTAVVQPFEEGHDAMAYFLADYNVDALICGGIGEGARNALDHFQIRIMAGVKGEADAVVEEFIAGRLVFESGANCNHHDHAEGGCSCSGGCGGCCH